MKYTTKLGAALLALLASLPALAMKQFQALRAWTPPGLIPGEAGVVVVNYYVRGGGIAINGSATPPTATQAQQVMKQSARITMAAEDIQARFTHNWGLDNSAPTFYEPEILVYQLSDMTFYAPSLTFDVANTNVVTLNKNTGAGLVGVLVTLRKPHSTGQ